jgi:cytoskeletal protein CcmA (bactofilin family)
MWPKKANKEPSIELSSEHTELKSVCLIALGTLIEGTVRVQEANMRLDGEIIGNVFCAGRIILSQTGQIKGDIDCLELVSEGKIEGNVNAKNVIILHKTAQVLGNIACKGLQIELGAYFKGNSTMSERV